MVAKTIDMQGPATAAAIGEAAGLLRSGELVAFPTETVYGLGANALDAAAVRRIFAAKGRPSTNPVIVHIAGQEQVHDLVREWPADAEVLAAHFWPGPLTLVLPRRPNVPDEVTAGGNTVGIRVPNHPVALRLLKECTFPVAAPSANRSNSVSPTTAQHVFEELGDRIPLILDGGPCQGGIESTVVNLGQEGITILRPGLVTQQQLQSVVRKPVKLFSRTATEAGEPLPSPGLLQRHYAPRARLVLVPHGSSDASSQSGKPAEIAAGLGVHNASAVATMTITRTQQSAPAPLYKQMPGDVDSYSRRLYTVLRELDASGAAVIVCELPPDTSEWAAVRDRLTRAATPPTS